MAFGHTHKPWRRTVDGIHFANTGSVGRPKDGDWRAGYTLVEVTKAGVTTEHRRVEYDLFRAQEAIRASDLPDEFAQILETGGALKG